MNEKKLTRLALCLSVAALGYTAWVHHRTEHFAELALQQREKVFVSRLTSQLKKAYLDMGVKENSLSKNPQTLEELFKPLIEIMDKLGNTEASPPDTRTNSNSKVK
jgi:hypothetical protein